MLDYEAYLATPQHHLSFRKAYVLENNYTDSLHHIDQYQAYINTLSFGNHFYVAIAKSYLFLKDRIIY